jgi:hypothetical protein
MKNKLNSLLLTAAVTLSAVAAYGQTKVTANIPFPFRTVAGVQAAGEYAVAPATQTGSVVKLENVHTGKSTFAGIAAPDNVDDGAARLTFRCGEESGCFLTGVTMGDGRTWKINIPRIKSSESEHVAVVYLQYRHAE